jgi:hypothetical protein
VLGNSIRLNDLESHCTKQKLSHFSPQVKATALGIKKGELAQKADLYGSAYQLAWK